MRRSIITLAALAAAAALIIVFAAGCGGSKSHDIESPWDGRLYGVATSPADNDRAVPLDAWILVEWPDPNYPPPAEFTVRLEKEETPDNWGGINSTLREDFSSSVDGIWWFEPSSNFSPFTWYRIIIRDNRNREAIVYFRTSDWIEGDLSVSRAAPGSKSDQSKATAAGYRPLGAQKAPENAGKGSVDHIIRGGVK